MKYIIGILLGVILLFLYCALRIAGLADQEIYKDK